MVTILPGFDLCICTKDMMPILPTFYALQALLWFISPFELLELAQKMFNRVGMDELTVCKTSKDICSLYWILYCCWCFQNSVQLYGAAGYKESTIQFVMGNRRREY